MAQVHDEGECQDQHILQVCHLLATGHSYRLGAVSPILRHLVAHFAFLLVQVAEKGE